jgi:voltage-gated potassium channel Kch
MDKHTWRDRLRYWFDNTMSKGSRSLLAWLGLIAAVVVFITALIIWTIGQETEVNFFEQIWAFAMVVIDTGPNNTGGLTVRLVNFLLVLTSVFILSTLIGILTTGLEGKLEELRKGRSKVVESGHMVILGWSHQVLPILSELVIANMNLRRSAVVLLGDRDKVQMEDEIRTRLGDTGRTRVICRSGNTLDVADLELLSLGKAKSIIIPSPLVDDPDSWVIKTMLAITKLSRDAGQTKHIVAELRNPKNAEVANILGKDEVQTILTGDIVARLLAQTCRQSGLSTVYTDLLDFGGDEVYFQEEPTLIGKAFGDALLAYDDSAVIGICPKDEDPILNPPMDRVINEGDQIVAISQDDDTVRVSGRTDLGIKAALIQTGADVKRKKERSLVLGWNWRAPFIITELDRYVSRGSSVRVVSSNQDILTGQEELAAKLVNQSVTFAHGDTTDRAVLEAQPLEEIDQVILLSKSDELDAQRADARTLITLLHLRDIADRRGLGFSIVSEMQDLRNRDLAEVTQADDFIVSDRLISLILTQMAENKNLGPIFFELFSAEGAEIRLKPATRFVSLDRPMSFYNVVEAAKRHGEIAIGYRVGASAHDSERNYGVVLNPVKSENVSFAQDDRIIILAED